MLAPGAAWIAPGPFLIGADIGRLRRLHRYQRGGGGSIKLTDAEIEGLRRGFLQGFNQMANGEEWEKRGSPPVRLGKTTISY